MNLADHYPETLRDIYDKLTEAIETSGYAPAELDIALHVAEWLRSNWSGRTLIPAWWGRNTTQAAADDNSLDLPEVVAQVDPIVTERGRELRAAVMVKLLSSSQRISRVCYLATVIAATVEGEWSHLQIYIPKAKGVDRAIRDAKIWREFNGFGTIGTVVGKYNVSQSVIYDISRRLQKDKDAREQPGLPGF